jgi:hypothetical protein
MASRSFASFYESKPEALILHPAHTQLNRMRKKCFARHSDPALREKNPSWFKTKDKEGFFARRSGLRMTVFGLFPEAVKARGAISTVVLKSLWKRTLEQLSRPAKQRGWYCLHKDEAIRSRNTLAPR